MDIFRRNSLIYGVLLGIWVLVVGWQTEEHLRVKRTARNDLRNRSAEVANTVSAFVRALSWHRGSVLQNQLQPVLNQLIKSPTNELGNSGEILSIALLNTNGEPVISAGRPINLEQPDILQQGEHWGQNAVVFANLLAGASLRREGETNPTFVLPSPPFLSNNAGRPFPPPVAAEASNSVPPANPVTAAGPPPPAAPGRVSPPPDDSNRPPSHAGFADRADYARQDFTNGPLRGGGFRSRRPPWLRNMDEKEFEALVQKRELHGLLLALSTENLHAIVIHDLWLRCIIIFFAGISAIGAAFAWRNIAKTSDLQIRLVRASELTTHLREMNLAAAGLAHETRNPLNIVRGLAQMISKQPGVASEIREKSRAIMDETDKVTAQLNEFINYSRPREVRRGALALTPAVNEVARALSYDLEEKKLKLEVKGDTLTIEADEQLLRQALFNLLLNATQAVEAGGEIQVVIGKQNGSEAFMEIRDNGPGVEPDRRKEIFKPYFTTHQKGTGLGLAVVQQIVLAHGWEIECVANEPRGAVFRITHLKIP